MNIEANFSIGQQFMTSGKAPRLCTVRDVFKTYNSHGELMKIRYLATHEFMGQMVADTDVCETTIARGLIQTKKAA